MAYSFSGIHKSKLICSVRGLDSLAYYELVRTLLDLLQFNFATVAKSDELLSAEPAMQIAGGKDIACLGGSNMSKTQNCSLSY